MRLFALAAGLLSACLASAARLTVSIPPSQLLPDPNSLPSSTHAVLLGPAGISHDVPLKRDNTFMFSGLTQGSYLLTLHSRDYFFPPFRVDVEPAEGGNGEDLVQIWQTFRGNEWSNKGPRYGAGVGYATAEIRPSAKKEFYQARGGFSLISFVKSPMILMALFSVVMIFGMPYLMDNMDPETKKEFDEMSAKSPLTGGGGAASQIQNFDLAGFLAGKSGGSDTASGSKKK